MNVYLFVTDHGVLFPKTTRSMQIFEKSAVEMFRKAANDQSFVAMANKNEEIAGYGVPQIIEERQDGSLVVFLLGIGKCRLGQIIYSKENEILISVEPLAESMIVDLRFAPLIQSINKFLAKWISTHIRDLKAQEVFLKQLAGPEEVIHTFATYLVKDHDLQQVLLESDSLNEKIQLCSRIIESNGIIE